MHEYPDPDAIAVGYAHRIISANFEIEADIIYSGTISHPQNIALTRAIDCSSISYEAEFDLSRYDAVVFVDHQGTNIGEITNQLAASELNLVITVDHHEDQNREKGEYHDIRKTGSTATIYT